MENSKQLKEDSDYLESLLDPESANFTFNISQVKLLLTAKERLVRAECKNNLGKSIGRNLDKVGSWGHACDLAEAILLDNITNPKL